MEKLQYSDFPEFLPPYAGDPVAQGRLQLPDFSQLGLYCTGAQPVATPPADVGANVTSAVRTPLDGAVPGPSFVSPVPNQSCAPPTSSTTLAREKNKAAQRAYRQRNKVENCLTN
jgi:hypothetical protein